MNRTEEQMHDIISSLIQNNPNSYVSILKNKYTDIVDFLVKTYSKLSGHPLSEYCYWFLNGLTDFPKCANENCGRALFKFRNVKTGYLKYCSSKCSANAEKTRMLYKSTCFQKYGVDHVMKSESVQEKLKHTCLEKYGVMCSFQSDVVKNKIRHTCQDRYGVEYALQSEDVKDKAKQTNIERYGVEYASQNTDIQEKARLTNLERYGVDNAAKSEEIKTKIKRTNMERYGVEHVFQSDVVKEKIKQTNLEKYGVPCVLQSDQCKTAISAIISQKYGVDNVFQSDVVKAKIRRTMRERYGVDSALQLPRAKENNVKSKRESAFYDCVVTEYDEPLFNAEYFAENYSRGVLFRFRCRKCGNVFESEHYDGTHDRCPVCWPRFVNSAPEKEIVEFMRQYVDIRENVRDVIKPLELDIYADSKKIAVEFDGLYWHSDALDKPNNYHLNKTNECEKRGIQLIHVFENEWKFKADIVKSRLKNLLGVYDITIFARKCVVMEIDPSTSREFQNANHIQGAVNSKVNLGLLYDGELISLMTFGKCRFDKKHEWEMLRFCNKLGYHIPGGAGKLLKYFERNWKPKSLVSYADRRWSQGKLYKTLGFNLDHVSPPDYWYWKGSEFSHRTKYQKHRLKRLFENFDENKTEVENMKANGYYRIFDCGNFVFEKTYF